MTPATTSSATGTRTPFDRASYFEAFASSLVMRGVNGVSPDEPRSRQGFGRVLNIVDRAVKQLRSQGSDEDSYRQLVRLRNELKPSSSGSYDGFEAALRSLQLTISKCPNPFYTEIAFTLSRARAEAKLQQVGPFGRDLASRSAAAFLEEVDA